MLYPRDILKRVTGVPLFVKVMGIALSLIALFGLGTIIETRALLSDSVKKEADERGRLLARYIESGLTDRLITGDLVAVSDSLRRVAEIYPDVKYLFILSPQKRVLVSTLAFPLSQELIGANAAAADGSFGEELLEAEDELINDIAAPLMGGRLGTLRIGISQGHLRRMVNAMTVRLLLSVFLVALLGAGISYLLAFILNKPILNLISGVEAVERGDSSVRVLPWFDDEIGRLTAAFNSMTGALGREKTLRTELVRKLITSQEEERQRISRELHDQTSQSLTSIKIGLKVMEAQALPWEAVAKFAEFRELLNGALDEIHRLAVELRPPALGDLGLPQVVEELGRNFKKAFNIEVKCAIDPYFRNNRLKPEAEIGLYRILQEAFSNIEKHSGASVVHVAFSKIPGELLVTVKDNGSGFDAGPTPAKPDRKSLGLYGMKERAEILGGKFSITACSGGGAVITVSLPENL